MSCRTLQPRSVSSCETSTCSATPPRIRIEMASTGGPRGRWDHQGGGLPPGRSGDWPIMHRPNKRMWIPAAGLAAAAVAVAADAPDQTVFRADTRLVVL